MRQDAISRACNIFVLLTPHTEFIAVSAIIKQELVDTRAARPIAQQHTPSSSRATQDTVGIWIEMTDAALSDSHGEGLIRWAKAFVRGLDAIPSVKRVVIPCSQSAKPIISRLFSEMGEETENPRLITDKLVISAVTTGTSPLCTLRTWADRKRKRCKERLESFNSTINPLTWPRSVLALAKESPSSLGLAVLSVARIGRLVVTAIGFGLSELVRPLVRHIPSTAEAMAYSANREFRGVTWIIPNPGWPAAPLLKGRKLLNIADIVYREFPLPGVSTAELEEHAKTLRLNAAAADKIICFSHHVARRHISAVLPEAGPKTVVIPHAPFETFPVDASAGDPRRRLAMALRHHFSTTLPHRHFCDFPFEEVDYLVVSSKCRPYKNYAGVLEAYERVLRRARRNVKLIVTAHLSGNTELSAMLHQKGLVFDVAEATNLPDDIHRLLLANAKLLIIPTLFEGGMPFGFAEAVGQGTPCVMAKIPAVKETLQSDELSGTEYFQPTDTTALSEAILHVLDNRDAVLARQQVIRERLMERTWRDVAAEYLSP